MLVRHRKNRNIIQNRKAFSSIVGAIFAILVIVSLTGTFFVWSLEQNSRYVSAVSDTNLLALEAKSESLNITGNPNYTVTGNYVTVLAGIQNDGPVSVKVTTVWVQDVNGSKPFGYSVIPNGYFLSPGSSNSYSTDVEVSGVVAGDSFTSWLITERGNVVPLYPAHAKGDQGSPGIQGPAGVNGIGLNGSDGSTWLVGTDVPPLTYSGGNLGDFYLNNATFEVYHKIGSTSWQDVGTLKGITGPAGPTGATGAPGKDFNSTGDIHLYNGTNSFDAQTALVAQGIGYVAMNFSKTCHIDYAAGAAVDGAVLQYPSFSYSISPSNATLLRVAVINEDPTRNITLQAGTCIWSTCTVAGTVKSDKWVLLNVTNSKIYPSDTNFKVVLPNCTRDNQIETYLYFGPAGGLGADKLRSAGNVIALNILLFGKLGTADYGQNLPFIALNVLP